MLSHRLLVSFCALCLLFCYAPQVWATGVTGTHSPYFSNADSPLVTGSPGYKLENFESGALAISGVTLTTAHGSSVDPGFSVDADDGSIDGSGAAGKSLTVVTQGNTTGATFTFNNVTLGGYPKSVGIAVTAANATNLVFNIYDTSNAISGTVTIPSVNTSTPTSDDFLFWGSDPAGISALSVSSTNAATSLHLDHLQLDTVNAIPEPGMLGAMVLGGLLIARRRKP